MSQSTCSCCSALSVLCVRWAEPSAAAALRSTVPQTCGRCRQRDDQLDPTYGGGTYFFNTSCKCDALHRAINQPQVCDCSLLSRSRQHAAGALLCPAQRRMFESPRLRERLDSLFFVLLMQPTLLNHIKKNTLFSEL